MYYSYFAIMHAYCYMILICHILSTHLVGYGNICIVKILWFETVCLVSIWTLNIEAFWLGFSVISWGILFQSHYVYKKQLFEDILALLSLWWEGSWLHKTFCSSLILLKTYGLGDILFLSHFFSRHMNFT